MTHSFARDQRGQASLIFVTLVCGLATYFVMNSTSVFKRNYDQKTRDFDQVLLNEVTVSTFAVMEAALARRLWEPPPDERCLKSKEFNVQGGMASGMTWKVSTVYNSTTKNFEMTARGTYRNLNTAFVKRVKVLDVSDYLLFSENPAGVVMSRTFNEALPTTLISRDRRLYVRGPLQFSSVIAPNPENPKMNFAGQPATQIGLFGTIIQGDRMQFTGGLRYSPAVVDTPNPEPTSNIVSLLAPYSNDWGQPPKFYSQQGGGFAVLSRDYNLATNLSETILHNGDPSLPPPMSAATIPQVRPYVYPFALFGGAPPLQAWTASDNGSYLNDPDRSSVFTYGYGLSNSWGTRMEAACFSRVNDPDPHRYCSDSEGFKKGFSNWRKNADLEGTLYTSDSEIIPSPRLNWDNFQALEEDAEQCGLVVSAPTGGSYEDCPVWEANFMTGYAGSGTATCPKIAVVDMNAIALNNFDPGALSDPDLKDRLQRRVIYLKIPTEIKQSDPRGIMTGLGDPLVRKNLSLWVVSEDLLSMRGYQHDQTSPLTSDPGRPREVVFNEDGTTQVPGTKREPISMVVLSPEKIHLLSPFYKPATSSYVQTYYPSSGGKIKPVIHNYTDYVRQEDDGFKYGYRTFRIGNMSLISNSNGDPSAPFVMRGLWSGPDSSAEQFVANQCMVSIPGQSAVSSGGYFVHSQAIPTTVPSPSPIPPPGSNYYGGLGQFPTIYYPQVFHVQRASNVNRQESGLIFSGTRIYTTFDPSVPAGKRSLAAPIYGATESRWHYIPVDLSDRTFAYDVGYYYQMKPPGTACVPGNVAFLNAGSWTMQNFVFEPTFNDGRYTLLHREPPIDYRGIGSIVGVEQPILETKVRTGDADEP